MTLENGQIFIFGLSSCLLKPKGVRFTNIQLEQSMFNNNSGIIVLVTKHKSPVGI